MCFFFYLDVLLFISEGVHNSGEHVLRISADANRGSVVEGTRLDTGFLVAQVDGGEGSAHGSSPYFAQHQVTAVVEFVFDTPCRTRWKVRVTDLGLRI